MMKPIREAITPRTRFVVGNDHSKGFHSLEKVIENFLVFRLESIEQRGPTESEFKRIPRDFPED